ncbi:hypothetical protein Gbem_1586 [Citrifermentans bemidjiense Bem]|uniref:Uncharacterized protein n=1 Tax=Citrifermentans bemidjiense (strain ATCC BAA-1014 / DSM 16622 / JCM 12645 / Bem) TaxID=404380 RepID=B5E8L9_CITBB|nr:hypothetical protein [Citrifermentans bemidjiense]ACH38604.1 hypothetical protein Gbem_1586 [Citrifermentans bemidjiense Bem]
MMTKTIMVALVLLLQVSTARAEGGEEKYESSGVVGTDIEDMQDKKQERACDCCQKCKAARAPVQPGQQQQSPLKKNGCEDCCKQCGRPLLPDPEDIPPEIAPKPRAR